MQTDRVLKVRIHKCIRIYVRDYWHLSGCLLQKPRWKRTKDFFIQAANCPFCVHTLWVGIFYTFQMNFMLVRMNQYVTNDTANQKKNLVWQSKNVSIISKLFHVVFWFQVVFFSTLLSNFTTGYQRASNKT